MHVNRLRWHRRVLDQPGSSLRPSLVCPRWITRGEPVDRSASRAGAKLCALVILASGFIGIAGPVAAKEGLPEHCWERTDSSRRNPTSLTLCFLEKGKLHGWDIDDDHGANFTGTWSTDENGRIGIAIPGRKAVSCQYDMNDRGNTLVLKDCTAPSMNGTFIRSKISEQSSDARCEPGNFPNDGRFEVARIVEKAPVSLELGQQRAEQVYADAGTIVVVWKRTGQHACVQSPTGIPKIDFWVDQKFLRRIPAAVGGNDAWAGRYGDPPTIRIERTGNGAYDIYGEYQHTIEDGPKWSRTTRSEISAHAAKPHANSLRVILRRNLSVTAGKAPVEPSPGFIDEHCKPVLFVRGPVLLVKDKGHCGEGSVFEGYWLRNR